MIDGRVWGPATAALAAPEVTVKSAGATGRSLSCPRDVAELCLAFEVQRGPVALEFLLQTLI
jgi:hypothetical protein